MNRYCDLHSRFGNGFIIVAFSFVSASLSFVGACLCGIDDWFPFADRVLRCLQDPFLWYPHAERILKFVSSLFSKCPSAHLAISLYKLNLLDTGHHEAGEFSMAVVLGSTILRVKLPSSGGFCRSSLGFIPAGGRFGSELLSLREEKQPIGSSYLYLAKESTWI